MLLTSPVVGKIILQSVLQMPTLILAEVGDYNF